MLGHRSRLLRRMPRSIRPFAHISSLLPLAGFLAVPLALIAAGAALAQGPPPPAVVVAPILQREVIAEQTFIGTARPMRTSVVGSAVEGRVMHLLVEEGAEVSEGQLLAELRTETEEIELRAAQAELALRQHELDEMTNGSRPEEIARAQADYEAAAAIWEYAKSALDRSKELFDRGQTISRDEYEEHLSVANAARQRLASAEAELELVQAGARVEHVEQARARLAMAQAEVDRIADRLEKYTIESPFDGYVVTKKTEVGQWIMSGDPVVEIVQLDPIDVEVFVPEIYIPNVELRGSVAVAFDSLPGDPLTGTVSRIVPLADPRSRTFPVLVRLPNPQTRLKAGMLAEVTLAVDRRASALLVPKDALVLGGPTPVVYVIKPGQGEAPATVRAVPVEAGLASGNMVQVTGELEAGQEVVIEGNERIFDGSEVDETRVVENPE